MPLPHICDFETCENLWDISSVLGGSYLVFRWSLNFISPHILKSQSSLSIWFNAQFKTVSDKNDKIKTIDSSATRHISISNIHQRQRAVQFNNDWCNCAFIYPEECLKTLWKYLYENILSVFDLCCNVLRRKFCGILLHTDLQRLIHSV